MSKEKLNIFWFRRDFRLEDNRGLFEAQKAGKVHPIFIFDLEILDKLEDKDDRRVSFIHQEISRLKKELAKRNSDIEVFYGKVLEVFKELVKNYDIESVYCNRDYEPYARGRDEKVEEFLNENGIAFEHFKDQCILEKSEVVKDDGDPYTVYSPYMRKWKKTLNEKDLNSWPSEEVNNYHKFSSESMPSLVEMGFEKNLEHIPARDPDLDIIRDYHETRDIPSIKGTTRLSMHLRFGTLSIRKLAKIAKETNEKWHNELIWRDFYMSILWHFPNVAHEAFNPKYRHIEWLNNEEHFEAWKKGETGYPIIDAGMRELNETGFMHNRVRMIVASFLTKHLFLNWQWGEAYFARKLNDFELSSNNGGWQWAASTGVDAAPYFRVFNPYLQTKKFDPELKYIKKWVPEFQEFDYPEPIVEHKFARERAIESFKKQLA